MFEMTVEIMGFVGVAFVLYWIIWGRRQLK